MEQNDPRKLLANVARVFDQMDIPYLVTGGMAVLIWGRPRFTADIDIVVELKPSDVAGLVEALRQLGENGYIDEEVVREIVKNGGEFNFVDGTTGIKVDFWLFDNTGFDKSRLERRVAKKILDQDVYFASPEDLILSKLKWYRESFSNRHIEDVESVFQISKTGLDLNYLRVWADKLGVSDQLGKLLSHYEKS